MKTKKLALMSLFVALSFVGSNIKIFGTIAFDSLPAFLAALVLGPLCGAIVGFIGHIFTSLLSGFPLGIPTHLVIAFSMAITMFGFGGTYKLLKAKLSGSLNLIITGVVGTLLNAPISLLLSYPLLAPIMGFEGVMALFPILLLASIANIIIAIVLFKALKKIWAKST